MWTEQNITIEYDEIKFDVSFSYTPGRMGTYEDPPEPTEIEIDSICLHNDDLDLYDVLSELVINHIEQKCFESME